MLTSKQRAKLKSIASNLNSTFQIGKGNLSDTLLGAVSDSLEKNEIVKITVLKNSGLEPEELIGEMSKKLSAEPVASIGNKMIIYRKSRRKDIDHIEL